MALQELAQIRKLKYLFAFSLISLLAYIFGGLNLGRNTIDISRNITPLEGLGSIEGINISNFKNFGNLSDINIKSH